MNRLKQLRKERKVSLNKLSSELNEKHGITVSDSQLSYYENEKRTPRNPRIWSYIAEYFGVSVPYLLGYEEKSLTASVYRLADGLRQQRERFDKEAQEFAENNDLSSHISDGLVQIDKAIEKLDYLMICAVNKKNPSDEEKKNFKDLEELSSYYAYRLLEISRYLFDKNQEYFKTDFVPEEELKQEEERSKRRYQKFIGRLKQETADREK